jgi:outer membrane protein OmpA-like peptidoglycan-associated protein/uncharacterized protein YidB (DUF937 family)
MFDELSRDIAGRFALGPKAGELVQMLLGAMTDPETDGLEGFAKRFTQRGFGDLVQGWLTPPIGATSAPALSATQVDTVLGGPDGLLARFAGRLGLDAATVASAVAIAAPVIMRRLAVGGRWRAFAPGDIEAMQAGGPGLGAQATPRTPPARRGGLLKWLPWLLLLLAVLFYITRCQPPATDIARPAPMVVPAVSGAAQPTTVEAIPAGAGALAALIDGQPSLKVYFDSGKAEISPEFAERAKALVDYLRTHAEAKAVVSGYSDPTGSVTANAAMSQQRAQAVSGALEAAGVPASSIVLEKPADITGTGDTNAESRRVEVTIRR